MERKDLGKFAKKLAFNRLTAGITTTAALSGGVYFGLMNRPDVHADGDIVSRGIVRNIITQEQELIALKAVNCAVVKACTDRQSFIVVQKNNTIVLDVCDNDSEVKHCEEVEFSITGDAAEKFRELLEKEVELVQDDIARPLPEELHERR